MLTGFFKNLVFQSKKFPTIVAVDDFALNSIKLIQDQLGEGLIACQIHNTEKKKLLGGFNSQESLTPFFSELAQFLNTNLSNSKLLNWEEFAIFQLQNNYHIVIIQIDKLRLFILCEGHLLNLGLIINLTIPALKSQCIGRY